MIACPVCGSQALFLRPEVPRDCRELAAKECSACSHVFLSSFSHIDDAYFDRGVFLLDKPFIDDVGDRQRHYAHETDERAERIGSLVVNKRVLDFGCGTGALMERLAPLTRSIEGVERTAHFKTWLRQRDFTVHDTIAEVEGEYDVILMFHVLEHLPDPVASLREVGDKLAKGGILYLEVPNANDALMTLYDVAEARDFLFFTDHLQYFTRQSLALTIKSAGLASDGIWGHNRFGLANHLFWLSKGKPGGHVAWSFLETPSLAREYGRALAAADISDSLTAQIRVEG